MKKLLLTLASAALMAVGCHDEIAGGPAVDAPDFTAVAETFDESTRTSMDEDRNILWSRGDQLAIFRGRTVADRYQVTDATAGTGQGTFSAVSTQDGAVSDDIAANVAFYPYMESLSCSRDGDAYVIGNVVLPAVQTYAAGSFGNGAFPMAAVTETLADHSLKFRNVMGAMRLQLTGTGIVKSVRIEGKNGEKLSGAATVTAYGDGAVPAIVMADGASEHVTLDCGDGVQLTKDAVTTFIIALPPVKFTEGFKVIVTDAEDQENVLSTSAKTNEILRSSLLVMPAVDLDNGLSEVHLTFTESDEDFANPERGFYAAFSTHEEGDLLSASRIQSERLKNKSIFYTAYYPREFVSSDISDGFLQTMRTNMQTLRDNGAKCILRFAYSESEDEKPWDATPQWVARHIQQIRPILQEYGDVIMCFQAGFVGVWGEWYYTENFVFGPDTPEEHALRKEVVDAMLEALPADRQVALRTPMFKRMMYAESYTDTLTAATAYDGSARARIGCFNDCFGASSSDYGTFAGDDTREFWKKDTRYVLMGGETCGVSEYCECEVSLKDMEDYHWTYLNSEYNLDVHQVWKDNGCWDEVKRRLGYRLSLTDVWHSAVAAPGADMTLRVSLKNTGFAAPMNGRAVEFVLVDEDGTKTVFECEDVDPRYWFANQTVTVEKIIRVPADASGRCTVYLNLPDPKPTLHDDPLFSIRLANDNVWDDETGYNKLAEFELSAVSDSEPEPDPSGDSASATGEDVTIGSEFNPWN